MSRSFISASNGTSAWLPNRQATTLEHSGTDQPLAKYPDSEGGGHPWATPRSDELRPAGRWRCQSKHSRPDALEHPLSRHTRLTRGLRGPKWASFPPESIHCRVSSRHIGCSIAASSPISWASAVQVCANLTMPSGSFNAIMSRQFGKPTGASKMSPIMDLKGLFRKVFQDFLRVNCSLRL